MLGSGFGSWFLLQSVDQRSNYLMTTRTIERWDVADAGDFVVVEANVGAASALTGDQSGSVLGKWATGRIPAGTLVTEGLFETPPLSSEFEAERMLIQVRLPAEEAPFGVLNTGDTIALLGRESLGQGAAVSPLALFGVLTLEFVSGDDIYYVVSPEQALDIKTIVDRYQQSADRVMVKLGLNLSANDLAEALEELTIDELQRQVVDDLPAPADPSQEADGALAERSGPEPAGDQ